MDNKYKKSGFTLIELLVVIAIIGLLATVVMISLNAARAKARDAKKITDFKEIQTALELYFHDRGYYPYTVDCSVPGESGWVYDNGSTGYTPDGIVRSWSQLETALAPYIKLPKSPGYGSYAYGATPKDYKLLADLQTNTAMMLGDGGCYPVLGSGCTSYSYEIFSTNRGVANRWTCQAHMCSGY